MKKPDRKIEKLENRICYTFKDRAILETALTHESFVHEMRGKDEKERKSGHYEQLEFLGDSVLGLAICHILFKKFPEKREGWLAKTKALVVSKDVLEKKAAEIKLGSFLNLGRGELKSGGKKRPSILVDSFEALIGALFLDGGYEVCRDFIEKQFSEEVDLVMKEELVDYKTLLQEISQSRYHCLPFYRVTEELGPEHEKTFHITVYVNNNLMGNGFGKTKKEAGQLAAQEAIKKLKAICEGND